MMGILDIQIIKDYIRMCDDGWQQGWHERNGGNLTYRMTQEEVSQCRPFFNGEGSWVNMGVTAPSLSGAYFVTTGSGKYFRNVSLAPSASMGIVEINAAGDAWRIVWGLDNGARPTSEFPSHFMNHAVRVAATDGACRVIYHAHPANIIAMTYVLPLTAKEFSLTLWKSATECAVVFPQGVGVVSWMVPGGAEIALATSEVMKTFEAAVWTHHGLFCSGPDFDTTFGLMHTIEKSAQTFVLAMSASGGNLRQTIQNHELQAIASEFGVELNQEFLK